VCISVQSDLKIHRVHVQFVVCSYKYLSELTEKHEEIEVKAVSPHLFGCSHV